MFIQSISHQKVGFKVICVCFINNLSHLKQNRYHYQQSSNLLDLLTRENVQHPNQKMQSHSAILYPIVNQSANVSQLESFERD